MAVAGRKSSDFRGFDRFCDACLTDGKHIETHKYCLDCREYLCKHCYDCHLKTKASKNHQFVDKDNVSRQSTITDDEVCFEKCPEHMQAVIKFFCPRHEAFCCHDCIIMHHRTCDVDYIPKKCADIAGSEEYRWTMQKLDQKLQELDDITKTANLRDKEIDTCHDKLIKEILKFRKEINDRLDQLQQEIQNEASKKKSKDKQITMRIHDRYDTLSSDIRKLQSNLQENKLSHNNVKLYFTMKQAQSKLKSDDCKEAEDGFERTRMQYTFERSNSLEKMLYTPDAFGKLSLSSTLNTPRKKKGFDKLTHTKTIYVRTETDKRDCWITACAVLSSYKLVLADYYNQKLKVVDVPSKSVVEDLSLDSEPGVIALLPQNKIAVTMPVKRQVLIMTTASNLTVVRTIPVKEQCRGITYHQGHLYIVCIDPLCVLILDEQGEVKNKIDLKSKYFSNPHFIVLRENFNLVYISDHGTNGVVSITLEGEVTAEYKHTDLQSPSGMLVLDDGSLMVCSGTNGTVRQISWDLKQCHEIVGGLHYPYSICYNHHLHEVYVGCDGCYQLEVLSPQ